MVSHSRGSAFPLEAYEIWTDYDALVAYAANTDPNKVPSYIGQKVAYVDKVNNKVVHYGIEIDGTLKELGVTPLGDGKTIEVGTTGIISLLGAASAETGTIPVLDDDKKIIWKTLEEVGAGDGNDNTTYTFTELKNSKDEVYGFIVKTFYNGNEVEGGSFTYSPNFYTKEEIDAQFDEKVGKKADGETAATGVYAYIDGVFKTLVEGVDPEAIDSLNDIINWAEEHLEDVKVLEERVQKVENILEGIGDTANGEKATVVEYVADKYAEKATTLAGYGITDAYTATQTDQAIAAKIKEMTGGESAADVLLALNNYKAANDREVWGDEFVTSHTVDGVYTPDYSGDSRVDTIAEKVNGIEAGAEVNIIETVKVNNNPLTVDENRAVNITVPTELSQLGGYEVLNQKVEDNSQDISGLDKLINGENGVGGLTRRLAALETEVGTVESSRIDALEGALQGSDGAEGLVAIVTGHGTKLKTIEEVDLPRIEKKADDNAQGLIDINKKVDTGEQKVSEYVAAQLAGIDYSSYATNARVDAIYKVDGETITGVLAEEIARAKLAEQTNADAIALLNNDEKTVGSVKHTVATELAKIISDDDTDIDTLNEIAAWIVNDTTGAAKMANDIAALNTKVDTGDQKVSEYVAAQIAAIPGIPAATASALGLVSFDDQTIKMNDNKQLYVAEVSTDNLVLGAKTLVLNGGDAEVETEE